MYQKPGPGWDNRYVIDVKRGIVVNNRTMTEFQDLIYNRNFFTNPRPDLTEMELCGWVHKVDLGIFFKSYYEVKSCSIP